MQEKQKLAAPALSPQILDRVGFILRNKALVGSLGFEPAP